MYHMIVLAYDGSTEGRLALREGARLAQLCGADVLLLAVVDMTVGVSMAGTAVPYAPPYDLNDYRSILDEGLSRLRQMGLSPRARIEAGEPVDRIVAVAVEEQADLVVVGHHRYGIIRRWLHPSVTVALADRLQCSLLAAKHDPGDDDLLAETEAARKSGPSGVA